jgi:predicted nucleic acid-binding protein
LRDVIIAATAELSDATVLHDDHDFDLVAAVTDQPTQWICCEAPGDERAGG